MADISSRYELSSGEGEAGQFDISAHYTPTQPYYQGVASGIESQALVGSGLDVMKLTPFCPPERRNYPPEHLACPEFFPSIENEDWRDNFSGVCWNYTMRRRAQKLLPYLYLGPVSAARDEEFLRKEGITLLLGIRLNHPSFAMVVNATATSKSLGIESEHIILNNVTELTAMMPQIVRGINNHVCRCPNHPQNHQNNLKKVLLFCETGNEKSVAVAIGYIMAMLNLDLATVVHNIQARRLCANFESPLVEVLHSFETIVRAQRDVVQADSLSVPSGLLPDRSTTPLSRKRSFQETSYVEPNGSVQSGVAAMDLDPLTVGADEPEGRFQPPPFCEK